MKHLDVVTIGAATRDVFLLSKKVRVVKNDAFSTGEAECFALGAKIDIDTLVFETGGGATNTAVSFARQGFRTAFVGKVGAKDARGREVLAALKKEKVDVGLVIKDKDKTTAYSVLLMTPRGERTALVYRGASADFHPQDISWPSFRSRWMYITSLGGSFGVVRDIWSQAGTKRMKIAWDPGEGELAKGLKALTPFLRQTDVLHVNMDEATELLRVSRADTHRAFHTLRRLVRGIAVVTMGTDGALAGTATEAWQSGTHNVQVVDTTGAGDAFTSGFVGTYIRTKKIPTALQFATANAESVVRHIGAKVGLLSSTARIHPVSVEKIA